MQRLNIVTTLIIVILLITSVITWQENSSLSKQVDSVKHALHLSQIQWDLVQLEGAIAYQIENEWMQPSHVTEKVGDVLQDIMVIFSVDQAIGFLTEQEKTYLDSLYYSLRNNYPNDNMVAPLNELSQTEIDKLIQLRKALRDVEWGVGFSNSGHWDSFVEKLVKLLPLL